MQEVNPILPHLVRRARGEGRGAGELRERAGGGAQSGEGVKRNKLPVNVCASICLPSTGVWK